MHHVVFPVAALCHPLHCVVRGGSHCDATVFHFV